MCAIIGALVTQLTTQAQLDEANSILNYIVRKSHQRGRDGRGFTGVMQLPGGGTAYHVKRDTDRADAGDWDNTEFFWPSDIQHGVLIGNLRAEPTSEYVRDKQGYDQQPYQHGLWSVVHNGTIANDRELRTRQHRTSIDSAAIVERLVAGGVDQSDWYALEEHFYNTVKRLRGSYAILATHDAHPDTMFVAANYRPVWYAVTRVGVFFASAREYFPNNLTPQMLQPYTAMNFRYTDGCLHTNKYPLRTTPPGNRALVVCSGGLDSVVAATLAKRKLGYDIELIHFLYECRAQDHEVNAVQAVAHELGVRCTLFPLDIYDPADSPLLRADSRIAGGVEGAEFAHEWVPARNLVMLSVATAYAEAKGFDTIVLGNNLEEAGAYPDNEPEFIARFNDLLPFAVGDGKRMRVLMPVGNLMKHEIVALGHKIKAPMHLTWSCYRAGAKHCGSCGPCYMRRTAFDINNIPEVIKYQDN